MFRTCPGVEPVPVNSSNLQYQTVCYRGEPYLELNISGGFNDVPIDGWVDLPYFTIFRTSLKKSASCPTSLYSLISLTFGKKDKILRFSFFFLLCYYCFFVGVLGAFQ